MNLIETNHEALEAPYSYSEEDLNNNYKRRFKVQGVNAVTGAVEWTRGQCKLVYGFPWVGDVAQLAGEFFTCKGWPVLDDGLFSKILSYEEINLTEK